MVWAYMGPRSTPPPLPDLEANMPRGETTSAPRQLECNWLQILEGDIDTTHVGFLHYGGLTARRSAAGQLLRVPAAGEARRTSK